MWRVWLCAERRYVSDREGGEALYETQETADEIARVLTGLGHDANVPGSVFVRDVVDELK
jgi:hypothetical protein